jgi:hypothetical protein
MVCAGRSPFHQQHSSNKTLPLLGETPMVPLSKGHCSNTFSVAIADAINTGIIDAQGLPALTPHHVFVDDDIYLDVFDAVHVEQAISASIEAIFILLGKSDLDL